MKWNNYFCEICHCKGFHLDGCPEDDTIEEDNLDDITVEEEE